jgi:DNA replication ATP-dependent helicase Dna2
MGRLKNQTAQGDAKLTNARSSDVNSLLSITQVHDIEEDMLSPSFGIKGKVDACLQVIVHEEPRVRTIHPELAKT